MRPRDISKKILAITRSRGKMYEYGIPLNEHIKLYQDPAILFDSTIGILGEVSGNNNQEAGQEVLSLLKEDLKFSAYFFDAYIQSKLNSELDQYLLLLGSSAYYLCDFPGSSAILSSKIVKTNLELDAAGLDTFLLWILIGKFLITEFEEDSIYNSILKNIEKSVVNYFKTGQNKDSIFLYLNELKKLSYEQGTPRELLLSDIIKALVIKRIDNSTWECLPKYTGIEITQWNKVIAKSSFIKEFWPAQKLLGENNIYKGASAIIQMPTSAGKTKATELIVRSSFLSGRANLAIIIAPYKALCHEINECLKNQFRGEAISVDELSDVIQEDFDFNQFIGKQQIIIVTPEKLNYVLRIHPEFVKNINLVIYDEGHLFDDNSRGVTYELLLSSLKANLGKDTQSILISAVIKNAPEINEWLLGGEGVVASGTSLNPTFRTVAFTSWVDTLGQLKFIQPELSQEELFYVPKVISQEVLKLKKRETRIRVFPTKEDENEIALYLGLKLVSNGPVAIFSGRKDTAASMSEIITDKYERELNLPPPSILANTEELNKLINLHSKNLGSTAPVTKAAALGIFMHHGNTPHGIKLAIEYALSKNKIHFVICTSTLAQGVNLPIKYLILANAKQGKETIKTRDFHNLIGRAGRAGMHTEGSIIFANPTIFDNKNDSYESWRWNEAINLLNPDLSEPCSSHLLTLLSPWYNINKQYSIDNDIIEFVINYVAHTDYPTNLISDINRLTDNFYKFELNDLTEQLNNKLKILSSIESYLMSSLSLDHFSGLEGKPSGEKFLIDTLAYYQASESQQKKLIQVFDILIDYILVSEQSYQKLKIYSQTFLSINDSKRIEAFVFQYINELDACESSEELIIILWPIFLEFIKNTSFIKFTNREALQQITLNWIRGVPYYILFALVNPKIDRIGVRIPKIEHIVDICENGFGYGNNVILNAITQLIDFIDSEKYSILINKLNFLQKQFKYGLPSKLTITLYELGFSDRGLVMEIEDVLADKFDDKSEILKEILKKQKDVANIISKYPSYFESKFNSLLRNS